MKKLFLAFTAFVGMLTGLSLTSCGGGGGGGNLAGTVFDMTHYRIVLNEQVEGFKDSYSAYITDPDGDHYAGARVSLFNVEMENGKLKKAEGNVASECFSDSSYGEIFVRMFWNGLQDVTVNMIYAAGGGEPTGNGNEGSMFTIEALGGNKVAITWHFAEKPVWKGTINGAAGDYWLIPEYNIDPDEEPDVDMINKQEGKSVITHKGVVIY